MTGSAVRLGAPPLPAPYCGCGRVIVRPGALICGQCARLAAGTDRRARADRARVMLAQGIPTPEIAEALGITPREAARLLDPELGHVQRPVERTVR